VALNAVRFAHSPVLSTQTSRHCDLQYPSVQIRRQQPILALANQSLLPGHRLTTTRAPIAPAALRHPGVLNMRCQFYCNPSHQSLRSLIDPLSIAKCHCRGIWPCIYETNPLVNHIMRRILQELLSEIVRPPTSSTTGR
jgi:hypothetical protein